MTAKKASIKPESHLDDLHTALRSCNEIGSARTLSAFLVDLQRLTNGKMPGPKHVAAIKNDRAFQGFLEGVILCTEEGYDESVLARLARDEPEHKMGYVDLISKVVEELLLDGKINKL